MNDYTEIESAQIFSLDILAFLFILSNLEKIRNIFKLLTKFPPKNVYIYHEGVLLISKDTTHLKLLACVSVMHSVNLKSL